MSDTQPAGTPVPTKLTRLTGWNIRALRETLTEDESARVTLGSTTATFAMDASTARAMVFAAQQRTISEFGRRGHPYQSLSTVLRKLDAAITAELLR